MNPHNTVVNLPTISIPLPSGAHCIVAAFSRARFVHAADGLGVAVVFGHDLLAPISELLFIPLDRFEKALQGPRRGLELQGNRFGSFAMQIR